MAAAMKSAAASRSGLVSTDDLIAAKSVAGVFGATDKVIAALQALERLENCGGAIRMRRRPVLQVADAPRSRFQPSRSALRAGSK